MREDLFMFKYCSKIQVIKCAFGKNIGVATVNKPGGYSSRK